MPAVFYPAAKVRFQIRFEDFIPAPPGPAEAAFPSPQGAEGFGPGTPQALGVFASVGLDLIPYTCSVERNSYRKADEARVVVPLSTLPFDPRIIRAATIQIFGGTFSAKEFADANGPVGAPGLLLPDAVPVGRAEAGSSNELFRGFVDDWQMSLEGHDILSITARDLTGPLIDAEIGENYLRDLPQNLPLDQLIQLLLTGDGSPTPEISRRFGLPGFRGLVVVNETAGPGEVLVDLPTLSEIRPPQWLDSKRTAKKGRKNSPGGSQKQSYWDAITDLVVSAGFIVFMRPGTKPVDIPGIGTVLPASEIVITNPRTYYGGSTTSGQTFVDLDEVRTFTYGLNINQLTIKRKLGGVKVPTVEVRAFDTTEGLQVVARFPPPLRKKNNRATPSGKGDREEVKVFVLDDIGGPNPVEVLQAAAQSIYEQLGRGEMEITIRTKHMAGLLENIDDGIEADLFRLLPSEPIRIEVSSADVEAGRVSAHTLFTNATLEQRVRSMFAQGVPKDVALQAAQAMDNPFVQNEFRCQAVNMSWSNTTGWEFQIKAINYLDVRDSVQAIEGIVP